MVMVEIAVLWMRWKKCQAFCVEDAESLPGRKRMMYRASCLAPLSRIGLWYVVSDLPGRRLASLLSFNLLKLHENSALGSCSVAQYGRGSAPRDKVVARIFFYLIIEWHWLKPVAKEQLIAVKDQLLSEENGDLRQSILLAYLEEPERGANMFIDFAKKIV